MTRYVTGKKGGGKSYFSMRILAKALQRGSRSIVTNLPLKWEKLRAYYHKLCGVDAPPLENRIRQIHGFDACQFFRFRGYVEGRGWVDLPEFGKDQDYAYSAKEHGGPVLYIIDEVHVYFNSRRWQGVTKAALDYMTLEDKIGDQVWLISQNLGQVDKYFRMLANEYVEVVNRGREMFLGVFRKPKMFEHITWYDVPNALGNGRGPAGAFALELDGLADCYDSAAGQGVEGLLSDRGESSDEAKGLPWWSAVVVVVAVVALIVQVPGWLGKAAKAGMTTMVGGLTSSNLQAAAISVSPSARPAVASAAPLVPQTVRREVVRESAAIVGELPPLPDLYVTGVVGSRNSPRWLLSDGSDIQAPNPRITAWSIGARTWVELDGRKVWH